MTLQMIAAITSHPIATTFVVLLVLSFFAVIWLLAYHGSEPQMDVTHRGPYRPPPSKDDPRYEATRDRQRELRDAMRANFTPHDPELQQRAKDAVAEYREKQKLDARAQTERAERDVIDAIHGRPLKGRRV